MVRHEENGGVTRRSSFVTSRQTPILGLVGATDVLVPERERKEIDGKNLETQIRLVLCPLLQARCRVHVKRNTIQ